MASKQRRQPAAGDGACGSHAACFGMGGGVVLVSRGREVWRVVCSEADLPEMYRLLARHAEGSETRLDWFEASLIADRLTERCGDAVEMDELGPGA